MSKKKRAIGRIPGVREPIRKKKEKTGKILAAVILSIAAIACIASLIVYLVGSSGEFATETDATPTEADYSEWIGNVTVVYNGEEITYPFTEDIMSNGWKLSAAGTDTDAELDSSVSYTGSNYPGCSMVLYRMRLFEEDCYSDTEFSGISVSVYGCEGEMPSLTIGGISWNSTREDVLAVFGTSDGDEYMDTYSDQGLDGYYYYLLFSYDDDGKVCMMEYIRM